jgi:putative ABC transport system permease protein
MAQLSLSLMLLTAAGLFVHSAFRAADVQPGFSIQNQMLAEVDASMTNYDEAHGRQLYTRLRERLQGIPGVESVAMAAVVSFGETDLGTSVTPANFTASKEHSPVNARFNIVTDGYFRTLGIPLLRGRSFAAAENMPASHSHVAILDKTAAERLFPKGDAIGKQIRLDQDNDRGICEVVGVAGDIRQRIFLGRPGPEVYVPFGQRYQADMQIHLKVAASGPAAEASMLKAIRHEIRATDERLPLLALKTMRGHLESGGEMWLVRAGAHIFEIFGGVALLLAVIGLYAVNAYTVARRTREIGIRMAIGADAAATRRMILSQGLGVTAVGVGIGLLLALGVGPVLAGFLYGVGRFDPIVLLAASAVLTGVALLACYLPARRASRIDPMIALRYE